MTRIMVALVAVIVVLPASASAQDAERWEAITRDLLDSAAHERRVDPDNPELEAEVKLIASELRCPVCQGLALQDSPVELAQQIRAVIREQLQAGRSRDEIRAFFVDRYGEWILLAPEPRGFNLIVYVMPFIVLAAGAGVLAVAVRRWSGRGPVDKEDLPEWEEEEEELHV